MNANIGLIKAGNKLQQPKCDHTKLNSGFEKENC